MADDFEQWENELPNSLDRTQGLFFLIELLTGTDRPEECLEALRKAGFNIRKVS